MFNITELDFIKPSSPFSSTIGENCLPFDSPKFDFRDAFSIFYLPLDCPLGRKCPMNLCPLSHTTLEKIFHPIIYKTKPCQKSQNGPCEYDRKCSFHHGQLDRARSDLLWQKWEIKWEGWRDTIKDRFKEKFPPEDPLHNKLDSIMKIRDWKDTFSVPESFNRSLTIPSNQKTNPQQPLINRNFFSQGGISRQVELLPGIYGNQSYPLIDSHQSNLDLDSNFGLNFSIEQNQENNSNIDNNGHRNYQSYFNETILQNNNRNNNNNKNNINTNSSYPLLSNYNNVLDQMILDQKWYDSSNKYEVKSNNNILEDSTTASPSTPINSSPARSCFSADPQINFNSLNQGQASVCTHLPQVSLPSAVSSLPHLSHQDLCEECSYLKKMSLMFYKAYIQQLQSCTECSHHLQHSHNHSFVTRQSDTYDHNSNISENIWITNKSLKFNDYQPKSSLFDANQNLLSNTHPFLFSNDL